MSKRDYYEVLEVTRTATDTEIKSSYRKLAMKFHPDRTPGDQLAEEKFKECAEAYAVLADSQKRSLYDRFGHAGVSSAAGAGAGFDPSVFAEFGDLGDILGNMFGFGALFGGAGGRRRGGPQRGADLRYDLEISFEESATGAETSIQIPRQETRATCSGNPWNRTINARAARACRVEPAAMTSAIQAFCVSMSWPGAHAAGNAFRTNAPMSTPGHSREPPTSNRPTAIPAGGQMIVE